MGKRIQRTGLDAVMECQRILARELMKLPVEDRPAVVQWLTASVMNRQQGPGVPAPQPEDPRQTKMFEETVENGAARGSMPGHLFNKATYAVLAEGEAALSEGDNPFGEATS